jgi:hypothetical protein
MNYRGITPLSRGGTTSYRWRSCQAISSAQAAAATTLDPFFRRHSTYLS